MSKDETKERLDDMGFRIGTSYVHSPNATKKVVMELVAVVLTQQERIEDLERRNGLRKA